MIIARKFLVGGVLTDATSIVLSDPTGTFGVRRTDTNAVVVADGAVMSHDGTGLYSYAFTEPAPGLVYEYYLEIVYNGATYHIQKFQQGTGGSTTSVGTIKISAGRRIIRMASRNAGDTTYYPTYLVDLAWQRAANKLIRECHLCLRTDPVTTVAGTASYDTPTNFRCDRLDAAWLTGDNVVVQAGGLSPRYAQYGRNRPEYVGGLPRSASLAIIPYPALNDMALSLADSGQPQYLAFADDGSLRLYPTPDQAYTVNMRWADFFTRFAPGVPLCDVTVAAGAVSAVTVVDGSDNQGTSLTASFSGGGGSGAAGTVTLSNGSMTAFTLAGGTGYTSTPTLYLGNSDSTDRVTNLPDDIMYEVLTLGAPAYLQFSDPEKSFAAPAAQAFRDYIKDLQGNVGGVGVQRVIRASR